MCDKNLNNPLCAHCNEPVLPGEEPLGVKLVDGTIHRECLVRIIVGSISHQLKKCPCYGGDWDDPPELTSREAARLAMEYWDENSPNPPIERKEGPA